MSGTAIQTALSGFRFGASRRRRGWPSRDFGGDAADKVQRVTQTVMAKLREGGMS